MTVADDVRRRVALLALRPELPLIVSDADEVLLQFVRALELFLEEHELRLELVSFALTGNIRERRGGRALAADEVKALLARFYEQRTGQIEPVPGAAEALAALSRQAQVVVLSNLPAHLAEARRRNLRRHGMDYPVLANDGNKGETVALLAAGIRAPVFFLDDIPRHLASVAEHAGHVHRMHFIADRRLARLLGPAEHCHVRLDTWPLVRDHIERRLASGGGGCA